MNKSQRKELTNSYKAEQRKNDPAFLLWQARNEQIQQATEVSPDLIDQWKDEELEGKIVDFVLNQFAKAGKRPTNYSLFLWERSILLQQAAGIQAIYATYLFENKLFLNASFWDFFYQGDGTFALETLKGYQLMDNLEMIEISQSMHGSLLKDASVRRNNRENRRMV